MKFWNTLAAVFVSAGLALAADKVSKELKTVDSNATVDVIVQYRIPPTSAHFDKAHSLGAVDKHHYTNVKAAAFTMTAGAANALANDPDVQFVAPDRKVKAHSNLTATTINANLVWQTGYDGTGVTVALVDSGVAPDDQDLQAVPTTKFPAALSAPGPAAQGSFPQGKGYRVIYAQDFTQPNQPSYQLVDDYGHGTHVAGIIAGNGAQSTGANFTDTYKGIAPNANIVSLRVLDQNGEGSDSQVIAAIDRAIALKNTYNIRVLNLSLGRPVYESFVNDPLCQAVEQAWQAGIVVVVAAGNDGRDNSFNENGYGTIDAPGNDPYVLTVGAMKSALTPTRVDDAITTYSSRGPTPVDHIVKPDIVAPGNGIAAYLVHGTLVNEYPGNVVSPLLYKLNAKPTDSSSYFILNGTSMATAVVSGAVALLLQAQPNLTPDQVKATLMLTATKSFNDFGANYFNATADAQQMQLNIATAQANQTQMQQAVQQAQNQLTTDQKKLTQDTTHQQQDAAVVASDQTALRSAQSAISAAQTAYNNALAAYNNAVSAQSTAQTNVTNAQAALQAAQKQYAGNSSQVQAAQAAQQAAQTALNTAQGATNTAQQNMNSAKNSLQNAQNAVTQAQSQLSTDQQHLLQDIVPMSQDNATVTADTTNFQTANQNLNAPSAWQNQFTQDQQTAAAMMANPSAYAALYDIFTVGAGYLDINAAVNNSAVPPAGEPALSPVAFVDPASGNVYASGSYGVLCGNPSLGSTSAAPLAGAALCSNTALYNASALWAFPAANQAASSSSSVASNQSIWASQSIWGSAVLSSNQSIWGSQSIWASQAIWGCQSIWASQSIWSSSSTQAYQSIWGSQSIWASGTTAASSTDSANSILATGDPGL